MNGPSTAVVQQFAEAFAQAGRWRGLSKDEILAFFRRYSNNVVDPQRYSVSDLNKQTIFSCMP